MFKKLKDKIAEEISPQRIQQFTQSVTDKLQNIPNNDENLFSIAEDDPSDMPTTHNDTQHGFQSISLHASTTNDRHRRNSTSSVASDVSFLPRYESNTNMYHLQSDLDVSASEIEDNASTSSGLGNVSKEQVYSAFQKAQMRYHKYRGRYTDLANHYKELERENAKMKAVLVETQDKAIRRVSELREQCNLSQRAKADLEQALRTEIEEKLIIIGTLRDKVDFLQNVGENSEKSMSNSTSISSFSENSNGNLEQLTKYLNEARQEIENLNTKNQELKANSIVFQSKEGDLKQKIANNEKVFAEKTREFEDRERETNIKFAKSKLELHTEIQNKDLEIGNLKKDIETLKTDLDSYENRNNSTNLQNLKAQNGKLIDKCESLQMKCNNFEAEMLKIEQYKQEIAKLQRENGENRIAEVKISELEAQIAEFDHTDRPATVEQEIITLKQEIAELNTQNKAYCDEIRELSNNSTEIVKANNSLRNCLNEKCKEIDSFKDEQEENAKIRESAISECKRTYETMLNETKAELVETQTKYNECRTSLDENKSEILDLRSKLADTTMHETKLAESQNYVSEYQAKLDECQAEIVVLKKSLADKESLVADLHSKVIECEAKLTESETKLCELQTKLTDSDANASEYKIKMDELMQENTFIKRENDENFAKIQEETKRSLLSLETKIKEKIQSDFDAKEQKLRSDFEKKLADLKANSDSVKDTQIKLMQSGDLVKELETKLEEMSVILKRKSQSYTELETNHLELIAENNGNTVEVGRMTKEISNCENEAKKLLSEIAKQKTDLKQCADDKMALEKEVQTLKSTICTLRDELKDLQGQLGAIDGLEEGRALLEAELKEARAKLKARKGFEEENSRLNKQVLQQIATFKDLQQEKSALQKQIVESKSKLQLLGSLKNENDSLRSQIDEILVTVDDKDATIKTLEGNLDRINQDFLAKKSELLKFEELNDALTKDSAMLQEKTETLEKSLEELQESFGALKVTHLKLEETNAKLEKANANLTKQMEHESQKLATDSEKHLKDSETLLLQIETYEKSELTHKTELEQFKAKLDESKTRLDQLKDYENKYRNLLDENQHLKEQLPQIEELKAKILILDYVQNESSIAKKTLEAAKKELEGLKRDNVTLTKKISALEADLADKVTEAKRFRQEIVELKILKDDLDSTQKENLKLINEIGELRGQLNEMSDEKRTFVQRLDQLKAFEDKYNESLQGSDVVDGKIKALTDEVIELTAKNTRCTSDNGRLCEENERLVADFEGLKLKHEQVDVSKLTLEHLEMSQKLAQSNAELEALRIQKDSLQQLQTSAQSTSESGTNLLQNKITELREMNEKFETAFSEHRSTKNELATALVRLQSLTSEKNELGVQLASLEHHYSEISHEKQLLLDEIQELKISPLNLNGDAIRRSTATSGEVDALRDKIQRYKSLDVANRTSIEFYEDELQKLRVKNEKLNRKLDETLVTLNHCADLTGNGMEVEYLKNVLYNYMLGKESLVMARVLTAVCKFDKDQTDAVLKNEQHKQSLLGQLGIL